MQYVRCHSSRVVPSEELTHDRYNNFVFFGCDGSVLINPFYHDGQRHRVCHSYRAQASVNRSIFRDDSSDSSDETNRSRLRALSRLLLQIGLGVRFSKPLPYRRALRLISILNGDPIGPSSQLTTCERLPWDYHPQRLLRMNKLRVHIHVHRAG